VQGKPARAIHCLEAFRVPFDEELDHLKQSVLGRNVQREPILFTILDLERPGESVHEVPDHLRSVAPGGGEVEREPSCAVPNADGKRVRTGNAPDHLGRSDLGGNVQRQQSLDVRLDLKRRALLPAPFDEKSDDLRRGALAAKCSGRYPRRSI
jgi:hypothetical protein